MPDCIFCGQSFSRDRKQSEEHAAPKWCRDLVPSHGPAEHILVVETADGLKEEHRGLADPFTTVAEDVCVPCNTGWMEELENWAECWLTKPIRGERRVLRYWRQACAAAWAVKTAMVWESVEPEHRVIPLDILRSFRQLQSPSRRQQVWIGHYSGTEPHPFRRTGGFVIGSMPEGSGDPEYAHAYLVALGVGDLAFVVFGHLLPMRLPDFAFPQHLGSKIIQIWPPMQEVVTWPPAGALDDADLDAIVRSLGAPISDGSEPSET